MSEKSASSPPSEDEHVNQGIKRRLSILRPLQDAQGQDLDGETRSLATLVQRRLEDIWEDGKRADARNRRMHPEHILVRSNILWRRRPATAPPPNPDHPEPEHSTGQGPAPSSWRESVVERLIKSRGLQLRLELLLLFEAQCRYGPDAGVRNVRCISTPHTNSGTLPWSDLVLSGSPTPSRVGTDPSFLRGRQITEALRVLQSENLIHLPTDPAGRRQYDEFRVLDETGLPSRRRYTVPSPGRKTLLLPRRFFTNLWVFSLTDTEIAVYLMLCLLRARFPDRHRESGVYVVDKVRQLMGITRTAYRSHDMLHRFRLIDRLPDPDRDYMTGHVLDFQKKYAGGRGSIRPHTFRLIDEALEQPALSTIHQVLSAPTDSDKMRRANLAEGFAEELEDPGSLQKQSKNQLLSRPQATRHALICPTALEEAHFFR